MRYTKGIIIPCFLCVLLFSCQKKELPVEKHKAGDVSVNAVNMGSTYKYELYYSLKNNTVVSQNAKTSWDLGFEASGNGFHVILNGSKLMYAGQTNTTDFNAVTDTNGFSSYKKCDVPSGNFDSTAIGDWRGSNRVYIIDRGYNENGSPQGIRKVQFVNSNEDSYTIRFAQLNGTGDTTLTLAKDSAYNYTCLSFQSRSAVLVEPPKKDWDLVFTQYTTIFYNPYMPYLVTGCLLNHYNTKAVMDSSIAFGKINYDYALTKQLSSSQNAIGYDWKEYSFNTSAYTIFPNMCYIIQSSGGFLYKLHFVGFYNNQGAKGNPQWEFQKL